MRKYRPLLPIIMIGLLLVAFGVYWQRTIWNECRDAGHSFMYCYVIISR